MDSGVEPSSETTDSQTKEGTYQRRREQVRRAQRLHRDRKAAYVAALEQEVEDLRAETAALRGASAADESSRIKALEREVTQLRAEKAERLADAETIAKLKELLELHGIDIPAEFRYGHSRQYDAVAELCGDTPATQHIQVTMPLTIGNPSMNVESTIPAAFPAMAVQSSREETLSDLQQHTVLARQAFEPNNRLCEDGTNGTQAGVDFILTLEQPCLYHHKLTSPELLVYNELGTGHAMMLSSPVMARVPPAITHPCDLPLHQGCQWNVPAAELEKLLSLSQTLGLNGEVTPVQIWQQLQSHSKFPDFTRGALDRVKGELMSHVDCYGFGAVVPKATVDTVISKVFGDDHE